MLASLGTRARLCLAALSSLLPLGMVWTAVSGSFTLPYYNEGTCDYADPGTYCTPEMSSPGSYIPGVTEYGVSSSARVFLVLGFAGLAICALTRRTAATLRLARLSCVLLAAAAVLAAAYRATAPLLALLVALALVAPLIRRRPAPT